MALLIALLRLEPNSRMGAQVTAVGCLVGLNHYSGQDIPAIGKQRQHNVAQALLQVSAREHTPPHIGLFRHVIFQTQEQVAAKDQSGRMACLR